MQTKHTLATVATSLLLLTACNSDNDQQANNQNSSDIYTKRLFLGGGT
ncbi:hypothetical protein JCM19235_6647 [Vibrio maritimus]|uniref:Uncharacterized protein n=1 Tax=Vibrio maritimus TaxID=990268 RepID=A0A090RV62_9VIBR|nr:hypothetical protein JCM19235_6647 [Vibrio maritimus]